MSKAKTLLAIGAAMSLSACNMVVSERPWFTAPDGPQLKEGLWANLKTPDCTLDAKAPIAEWPECATPMLVSAAGYSGPTKGPDGRNFSPDKWQAIPHVLVGGNPQIDQLLVEADPNVTETGAFGSKPIHLYLAVRPLARDDAGWITATERWPVMCGPMPKAPRKVNGQPEFTSDRPFKGIRVDGNACYAASIEALRGAATASETVAQEAGFAKAQSRWVRSGI